MPFGCMRRHLTQHDVEVDSLPRPSVGGRCCVVCRRDEGAGRKRRKRRTAGARLAPAAVPLAVVADADPVLAIVAAAAAQGPGIPGGATERTVRKPSRLTTARLHQRSHHRRAAPDTIDGMLPKSVAFPHGRQRQAAGVAGGWWRFLRSFCADLVHSNISYSVTVTLYQLGR
jgi:hypothetical protein